MLHYTLLLGVLALGCTRQRQQFLPSAWVITEKERSQALERQNAPKDSEQSTSEKELNFRESDPTNDHNFQRHTWSVGKSERDIEEKDLIPLEKSEAAPSQEKKTPDPLTREEHFPLPDSEASSLLDKTSDESFVEEKEPEIAGAVEVISKPKSDGETITAPEGTFASVAETDVPESQKELIPAASVQNHSNSTFSDAPSLCGPQEIAQPQSAAGVTSCVPQAYVNLCSSFELLPVIVTERGYACSEVEVPELEYDSGKNSGSLALDVPHCQEGDILVLLPQTGGDPQLTCRNLAHLDATTIAGLSSAACDPTSELALIQASSDASSDHLIQGVVNCF